MPDTILLCGGEGRRLRSILGDTPKGMADIGGRPFLELLLRQLQRHGFRRAILAVGYRKDIIRSHFGESAFGLSLAYAIESAPLGTGGALRNAADLVESDTVLVMNGDTYTEVDLHEVATDYDETTPEVSIVVVPADGRGDCGSVLVDESGKLAHFQEKQGPFSAPYFSAGIYMLSRRMLYEIPPGIEVSLEQELLPRWIRQGRCIRGFVCPGRCFDIGTPERYRSAQGILANVESTGCWLRGEGSL